MTGSQSLARRVHAAVSWPAGWTAEEDALRTGRAVVRCCPWASLWASISVSWCCQSPPESYSVTLLHAPDTSCLWVGAVYGSEGRRVESLGDLDADGVAIVSERFLWAPAGRSVEPVAAAVSGSGKGAALHADPPVVDWTPDSGIDAFTVRCQALTEVRSSDPIGRDSSVLPPDSWDGVRYIVAVGRDEDPIVVIATASNPDVAAHIAETHNARLDKPAK